MLSTFQCVILIILGILIIHYLLLVFWVGRPTRVLHSDDIEGFDGGSNIATAAASEYTDKPYDGFYAKVYDQLIQGGDRTRFEVQDVERVLLSKWTPSDVRLLVLGSGTGHAVEAFRKAGYNTTGADSSTAMVEFARGKYPESEFVVADMENRSAWQSGQWTHAFIPYFTIYYAADMDVVCRNLATWIRPGGGICLHLVNKYKFDPLLESASPFPAFSVQRYSKERQTRSDVVFDKFTYAGDFQLSSADPNRAVFRETFHFKDGRPTRIQEHKLNMPALKTIVDCLETAGFQFIQMTDLIIIGYEYQYLFYFSR